MVDESPTETVAARRFEVRRSLGSGGFGEVFEAWDHHRESTIALKTLHQRNPHTIRRFKHEFRSLAGLSHPNLVQLYELVLDGDRWSFSMELVRGRDFLEAVSAPSRSQPDSSEIVGMLEGGESSVEPPPSDPGPTYDEDQLRAALRQLVRGLRALHEAGKLHRDIKPQNVLVDESGRVVILDFGMVKELAEPESESREKSFVGTPHYMAPEQAMEDGEAEVGEAADWYSVGVMLYEVLCGEYPVTGRSAVQILLRKQVAEAPSGEAFPDDTPDELREICQRLLTRAPDERIGAEEILRILGDPGGPASESRTARRDARRDGPFVGRREELAELRTAIRHTRRTGRPAAVDVIGASGIGKTELVRVFLDELSQRPDVWVLEGRCYENESVPYKALDGVVDQLVDRLPTLDDSDVDRLLQGDLAALSRVFGVFANLAVVRDFAAMSPSSVQSAEVRKSAFSALRGLMVELCNRVTPVIVIDDAQWGDRDSADVLASLLRQPAPPMLILTTYRTDERAESPFLHRYEEVLDECDDVEHVEVSVRELSAAESDELARKLAGDDEQTIARIVAEASGSPYFIDELARFRGETSANARTLDDAIEERMTTLDASVRRFLEVIALAGRPLDVRVVREVTGARVDLPHAMARLRNERLVRVRTGALGEAVETYHDRIRETIRDRMPDSERRRSHLRLARVLQRETSADPEMLATHFREGGDHENAATFTALAVDAAMEALAFDRASEAYREALNLGTWTDAERLQLLMHLGEAQSYLGRGNEAAEAFARAAPLAEPNPGIELRRRAAQQLLRAGQIERGLELLFEVLEELGVRPPRSEATLGLLLAWETARKALRGRRFVVREEPLDELEAIRIDTCWSAANLLGTVDVKRGAYFQMLNLRQSLDSGDPERMTRTLALESVHLAGRSATRSRAREVLETARELSEQTGDSFGAQAYVDFSRAMSHYMAGDMRQAQRWFSEVGERLESRPSEFVWEAQVVRLYETFALHVLGELGRLSARIPTMLEETLRRDDLLGWTAFSIWDHLRHLAADDPGEAEAAVERATTTWTSSAYHVQHFWALQASVRVALYRAQPDVALELLDENWAAARRGFMLHYDLTQAIAHDLRGRALLAVADRFPDRRRAALRRARREIRRLRKVPMDFAGALATLLEAQRAHLDSDATSRDELLARAEAQFSGIGAELFVSAVRMRLGDSLGPARGGELRARALRWARNQGVVEPERFLAVLAPVRITPEE
jgi:tetratricopeptide (TPR) repeat protein